jgi:precorrin-3B synthase
VGIRSIRAVVTPPLRSDAVDACPGALRLHAAADGPLARVRVPGGLLTGAQLRAVRALAERWGDGRVELTSRANLQLRGLTGAPAAALAAGLRAAGLLPSETHELVRNIAASPGTPPSARPRIGDLDRAICADPGLAELPGRFLFALDDGTGDVAPAADVAAIPAADTAATQAADKENGLSPGRPGEPSVTFAILFAGSDVGLRVPAAEVIPALIAGARAFLAERAAGPAVGSTATPRDRAGATAHSTATPRDPAGATAHSTATPPDRAGVAVDSATPRDSSGSSPPADGGRAVAWRVRELTDGPARVGARTAAALGVELGPPGPGPAPVRRELTGRMVQPDGRLAVGALVPFGTLSGVPLKVLEKAGLLVLTPARGVVVPDLSPAAADRWLGALGAAGLEVTPGSPWSGVTACAGQPGCAKALADVRRDARATVPAGAERPDELPVHWVGCARGCGSPGGRHVRVEATADGYLITDGDGRAERVTGVAVAVAVAAARRG